MNTQSRTKNYMLVILTIGFVCLVTALFNLSFEKLDFKFLILFGFTIGLGSRITLQIPKIKTHIAVSDTFIFLALLIYGGETAIVLAAVEAFFSSWRFCNKKITVFFNVAAMALSTTIVVSVLKVLGLYTESQLHGQGEYLDNFIVALSVMALTQFIANTTFASIYGALKSEKPLWETWKTKYVWTFITYFVGAVSAGILLQLTYLVGFGVVAATFPIIFFVYLTYRMYLKNVEMATTQAEQAEQHAEILQEQSLALRESEERFRSAFNYAPIGIALVSPAGDWLKVNHALCEILGYAEEEFLKTDFQSILFSEDLGDTLVKIHELLAGKILTCQMEQRYLHKNRQTVWASLSVSAAIHANSGQPNLIFQIQDITAKKLAEDQLQYEAKHDALTNLPNRAFFMSRLEQALNKANANFDYQVSVLFIDLDRFKLVNDSLGHLIGDQLLIGIAGRLRECLRPDDIVARLGGDEFTILVEGEYEPNEVVRIAERLQEKFAMPFDLSGNEIYSSASIGILHRSEKHLTPEDMMRDADTAMYQAKRAGKARHEVFDQNMHEAVKASLQLETDLRRAIDRDELCVYYQPIYSLTTEKIEGFEALARWNHKEFGLLSPNKFISLAEEINLIDALGEQILRKACSQMQFFNKDLADESSLIVSVNLSCKQFAQPNLVKRIKRILKETEFPPHLLKLEITESVFFEHKEKAVEMLHQLRELGIEINIDDFGTGYSNLSYLMQLPISTLKIDRSFISPIKENGENIEIVEIIMMLARNLGMKVIAEGVETEAQLKQLKKLNCEGAQGYFFSKPLCFEDVRQFLDENLGVEQIVPEGKFEDVSVVLTIQ
ncbi:MAG: putative bifunctional diguanylate cyclase/phosphodiesterase [Pyrinomonadaceae bacterium]